VERVKNLSSLNGYFAIQEVFVKLYRLQLSLLAVIALLMTAVVGCGSNQETALPVYPDQQPALTAAVDWLIANHQNDDGGYSSFSGGANLAPSDVGGTLDVALAMAAAGHDPAVNAAGKTANPIAYLRANAADLDLYAQSGGGVAGKAILSLTAAGQNPRDFQGHNLVANLTAQLTAAGDYNAVTVYEQSLALLGLAAVNETAPAAAVDWIKNQQTASGAWGDGYGTDENSDATAVAIMALLAHGETADSPAVQSAVNFLRQTQLPSGGWEYGPGFGQNGNSAALVMQALSGLNEDFYTSASPWAKEGQTPLAALLSYRSGSGAFQADFGSGPFDDFFTTVQALPAVAGKTLPISAP
jgi:hypothetical protein